VARGISRIIFENLRASCNCVDYGLIVKTGRGLYEKRLEYLILELFLIENCHGPGPELGGPWATEPRRRLVEGRPERHPGVWNLTTVEEKGGGDGGDPH
jgi:hypothetical protein